MYLKHMQHVGHSCMEARQISNAVAQCAPFAATTTIHAKAHSQVGIGGTSYGAAASALDGTEWYAALSLALTR